MPSLGDIVVERIRARYEERAKIVSSEYKRRYKEYSDKAKKEYRLWQDNKIKEYQEWFRNVISEWYADHTPIVYDRQHGLYNIFDIERDDDLELTAVYNEKKMHGYRSGFRGDENSDSLFRLIFIEGWHGGAKSGDYTIRYTRDGIEYNAYTPHPSPGVPYYREPVPYYTNWGRRAVKSFSPYERIETKLNEDMSSGVYEQKRNELLEGVRERALAEAMEYFHM